MPTQNATIDSQDIEDAMNLIRVKGYGLDSSSQLLIIANPVESELIQTWRSGKESRSGGPIAKHDFRLFTDEGVEVVGASLPG
ncbi:hypothetical protein [Mycobacteroides abscessus]|uniref:hypothetical protein n=1 Tax=Mycobacteroides abscessus TaxID=36809 RepID=UPI0009A4B2A4|nr:hypothetical protein [Mycobacteroides abscessus]